MSSFACVVIWVYTFMVVFKSVWPSRCWTCFKVIPASKHKLAWVCLKPWILIGRNLLSFKIPSNHFLGKLVGIGLPNSFSKIYLVPGFCFLHFFKIFCVVWSKLINRLLLTVLVEPNSSPAKPLVISLFIFRVLLLFQSFHSSAKISLYVLLWRLGDGKGLSSLNL